MRLQGETLIPALLISVASVLGVSAHAQDSDESLKKEIQVELGTTQESRVGASVLTVRTLALSGDISPRANLELEQPFWVSQTGLRQNPTIGLSWALLDSDTQSLTFHPQYDFGNPALAARQRLKNGGQNLILPLEAEFGRDTSRHLSLALGLLCSSGGTTAGTYSIGFSQNLSKTFVVGTELEGASGQDLVHLHGELSLTKQLHLALDYAIPLRGARLGQTCSLAGASLSSSF